MGRMASITRGRVLPSPRSWAMRGSVAALALALGYVSVTHSVAYSIGKGAPERGHALAPSDGRIASLLAHKLLTTKTGVADRENAARIAQEALAHEPLA